MNQPQPPTASTWYWGPYASLGLTVAVIVTLLDQLSKWWIIHVFRLPEKGDVPIAPFVNFIYKLNTGISYSLLDIPRYEWQLALATLSVIASLALWVWLSTGATNRLMAVSLGLVIGGAIGNAIDRIVLQGVADFVKLQAFGYSWYVFNIADAAIVAGVAGLLYDLLVSSRNDAANPM